MPKPTKAALADEIVATIQARPRTRWAVWLPDALPRSGKALPSLAHAVEHVRAGKHTRDALLDMRHRVMLRWHRRDLASGVGHRISSGHGTGSFGAFEANYDPARHAVKVQRRKAARKARAVTRRTRKGQH